MRWKRLILRIVGGIVVSFLLTTVWLVGQREYRRSTGNRELASAIAEADAADPDWTWERLNATRPKPPAGRNGAEVIPRVRDLLPQEWVRDVTLTRWVPEAPSLPPNVRYPPLTIASARETLARATSAVNTARTLKDCPNGYRDIQLAPDVFSTPLRDTPSTRTVSLLLRWEAVLAIEDGDTSRLTEDNLALLNTSRSLGDEPFLISQLVRISTRIIAVQSLEQSLAQTHLGEASLAILQAAWTADADEPLLLYGVRGERAAYDVFLKNLADGTITPDSINGLRERGISFESYAWWLDRGRLPADRAYYIRWMTQAEEAARRPLHQQLAAIEQLPQPEQADPNIRFALLVLPAVEKIAISSLRSTAQARCAVVGLACERFRLQRMRWPQSLNELVPVFLPVVPLDPFTAEPLQYTKLKEGVVVYSVGQDRRYDGGSLAEPAEPTLKDAKFRLWNPDQRRLSP